MNTSIETLPRILPQMTEKVFLTDGGLETTMIFKEGFKLPCFAAFILLTSPQGTEALRRYYRQYLSISEQTGHGFILESPTWRANRDWCEKLGFQDIRALNIQSIQLLEALRQEYSARIPILISGCVGPRGDGYFIQTQMSVSEAKAYHSEQIELFASTSAHMICAMTITYPEEAIGIVLAAKQAGIPAAISFTCETDGLLPSGHSLQQAIEQVDAATSSGPAYYMINCAHPEHFGKVLAAGGDWVRRIRGVRANASRKSHTELDEACELDEGDPLEIALQIENLRKLLPQLTVLGGCCGTDHRHIQQIGRLSVSI